MKKKVLIPLRLYTEHNRLLRLIKADQKINNCGTDKNIYFSKLLQVTDSLKRFMVVG